jgi:4-amino-4-deoxy-L-arabinose transferase-like glycosyltransferase
LTDFAALRADEYGGWFETGTPAPVAPDPKPAQAEPVTVEQTLAGGEGPVRLSMAAQVPEGMNLRLSVRVASLRDDGWRPVAATATLGAASANVIGPAPAGLGRLTGLSRPAASRWREASVEALARWRAALRTVPLSLENVLFGGSLLVYLLTRLIGLDRYPIYFFTDEAIQTLAAVHFVENGLTNHIGEVLPTYFQNGPFWNLSVSVYLQVIPYLLFGKSIWVTRGTSVVVSLLAAGAVGLALKRICKIPYWWAGVLLLSAAPAWFLHSRTAFETAEMTALYAGFLYAYLLYRYESPRYLYAALVLGALAFYTYSPGQLVVVLTGALLLVSDWRYHYANRAMARNALILAALLALPYLRFRIEHPEAVYAQLRERGSLLVDPNVPLAAKLGRFAAEYGYGLSFGYWFSPNGRDLGRHIMVGYGNLPLFMLPLALLGLVLALRNFRSPAYRAVLIALLASPAGGALAEIGVTRVLMFVIPASLLAGIGLSVALEWLERWRAPRALLAAGAFALLAGFNVRLLGDALANGPLWVRDYGLGGMQYGAKQLFADIIPDMLARDPDVIVSVSSGWANGPDLFPQFFLTPAQQDRVQMLNLDYFLLEPRDLPADLVLVMTPEEYAHARETPKLKQVEVLGVLPYPDGSPGFYFTRIAYADDIEAVFAAEQAARRQLVVEAIQLGGETVEVGYSALGGGQLRDMLDGDPFTLARGYEANPFVLEIAYPEPRAFTRLLADFGSMPDFTVTASLYPADGSAPVVYRERFQPDQPDPHVEMALDQGPPVVSRVRLEILLTYGGPVANIHVREVTFQ